MGFRTMRTFAFIYFMVDSPTDLGRVIPEHVKHWEAHRSGGYRGGPFADRSGGLIVFEAPNLTSAEAIARADPFMTEGLLAESWLKEWNPE
jgi:uncharacterized protein YciI